MPVDLHWNLEGDHVHGTPDTPEPVVVPPGRKHRRWIYSGIYLFALLAAAYVGFTVGRSAEAMSGADEGINNQIAVEQLAWSEGDAELYVSTLHPEADPIWRDQLVGGFTVSAPLELALKASTIAPVTPFKVEATVVADGPLGNWIEERVYQVSGNGWYLISSRPAQGSASPRP